MRTIFTEEQSQEVMKEMQKKYKEVATELTYADLSSMCNDLKQMLECSLTISEVYKIADATERDYVENAINLLDIARHIIFNADEYYRQ